MRRDLWPSIFPMQLTKRVYLFMILLVSIPMILLSVVIWVNALQNEKLHRGDELYFLASKLDRQIGVSFDIYFSKKFGLDLPREQQVNFLNGELQPIIDTFTRFHPSINLGYYSKQHDRILAIGPDFDQKFLQTSDGTYPYSKLFETNQPELEYQDSSIYWEGEPVLTQVFPMYRNGELIGYTWASVRMDEIYKNLFKEIVLIFFAGTFILGLTMLVTWWVFRNIKATLVAFAQTIVSNTSQNKALALIPELNPILEMINDRTCELIDTNNRLQRAIQVKEKTEYELLQSEERFSKAFEASPSLMCILDYEKDFFVAVNESFLEKIELTRGEIVEKPWREVIHLVDSERLNDLKLKIEREEEVHNSEVSFYSQKGQLHHGLVSIEPIMLNGKKSLLCVITDITEFKHLEHELMKLDRLNLIGQMAAGISHEIRNPLTTVRGFLQMLGAKEASMKYQDYYTIMIDELDRANSIITEFLSISRNKSDEQKYQNLNTIIIALAPLIEADAMGQENALVLELGEIPNLYLNEKELRQVILNLSRNGLEAMEKGGRLLLKTYKQKGEVILCVRDSGKGMSPEVLRNVGTPFFTTKDRGTGLGLAVCYGIVARHNAKMTVSSGTWGTEFQIHFPIANKDAHDKVSKY